MQKLTVFLSFFIIKFRKGVFMKDIDYYIEQAATMKNTSDGGSASYLFDDVVLVKYTNSVQYGEAREKEEEIAVVANEKNAQGVRTPKHLAIKREVVGDTSICWVLQERAKGENFSRYSQAYSSDVSQQLERQLCLASAPSIHYEQFISDVCAIFNMGLELKPKNLFYDKNVVDGGFTIIDLLFPNGTPLHFDSLKEVLDLLSIIQSVCNSSRVSFYNKEATEEQIEVSSRLSYKIMLRMMQAMQKVIPSFEEHRRWILRTFSPDLLEFFSNHDFVVGDLSLTEQEYVQFEKRVQSIVDECLSMICNGEVKYWQVMANEIRISLDVWGMQAAWLYHKDNGRNKEEFEDEYEYFSTCKQDLENLVAQKFHEALLSMASSTDNVYLSEALCDYEKSLKRKY